MLVARYLASGSVAALLSLVSWLEAAVAQSFLQNNGFFFRSSLSYHSKIISKLVVCFSADKRSLWLPGL